MRFRLRGAVKAGRFRGIDIARLFALVGMIAAHTWAPTAMWAGGVEGAVGTVVHVATDGFPSTLFAVVGGVSLTLASVGSARERGAAGVVVGAVVRGLIVAVIGAVLALAPSNIYPVLVPFGVAMMCAAVFLVLPTWIVAGIAGALWICGGTVSAAARVSLGVAQEGDSISAATFAQPGVAFRAVFITGVYPVITWLTFLLIGVLIARVLIAARARGSVTLVALAVAGIGAAAWFIAIVVTGIVLLIAPADAIIVVGDPAGGMLSTDVWTQALAFAHSGTPADIAATGGMAAVTIGLLVALVDRSARAGVLTTWLAATGAAPLTIYAVHFVVNEPLGIDPIPFLPSGLSSWVLQVLVVLAFGAALGWLRRRGPLEAVVSETVRFIVRSLPSRP